MSRTPSPTKSAWALIAPRLGKESDGSIAKDLHCSPSTVRKYRQSLGISAFGTGKKTVEIYQHLSSDEARAMIDIVALGSWMDGPLLFGVTQTAEGQRIVRKWGVRIYDLLPRLKAMSDDVTQGIVEWARDAGKRVLDRDFLSAELKKFDGWSV